MSTQFDYCYRDAANWKRHGSVVFSGTPTDALLLRLKAALHEREWFIADQVRLPELFIEPVISEDDHCWHECVAILPTSENLTDLYGRSIEMFVAEVERASSEGWMEFDRNVGRSVDESP